MCIYVASAFTRRIETCIKNKNAKSNYGYSYFLAVWYVETKKKRIILILRVFLALRVAASKFL